MSEFTIEKGIPISPSLRAGDKYPFAQMEVGDSFIIPVPEGMNYEKFRNRITAALTDFKKRNQGWKAVSRKREGGIRVWRTA